ncbi:hypothetical protein EDB19DRAFT_1835794 [Suillus lakei]|nr:hypothetical protein EDB19DRAFT_1835794 [Suillus lakei]
MPCPPIHTTLEAKQQANREKNRCHYVKELRVEKNTGPSELQKAIARALHGYDINEDEDVDELEMSDNSSDVEENNNDTCSDLLGCLVAINRIKDDMLSLINKPCAFTEALLLQFIRSIVYTDDHADNGDQMIITNVLAKVQDLLNQAILVQDKIHNFCGSLAAEYHAANTVCRYLSTILAYLEDIEYYFVVGGISELCVAHSMVQPSPEPSFDAWEETLPNKPNDPSFENVDSMQDTAMKTKRIQNVPLLQWIPEQSSYLDKIIHLEGCSDEIA